jgi:Raf kinase inhibitor-like YbhB/YbcL family protein
MKNKLIIVALGLIVGFQQRSAAQTFTLKSPGLGGQFTNTFIAKTFGCNGENKSPQLTWTGVPQGTKSFAVTMYDMDAPTGSGWWHWLVFDITANISTLVQDAGNPQKSLLPEAAIQGLTDFGKSGYGGPCPPVNDKPHAYIITLYALKVASLGLDKNATPALAGFIINQNLIEKTSIVVYSQR